MHPSTHRSIHNHKVSGVDTCEVLASRDEGRGGAPIEYVILFEGANCRIRFQEGPDGVNGLTNEALLAVVMDRLSAFQRGPNPCVENAIALGACVKAIEALKDRTCRRTKHGLRGTMRKHPSPFVETVDMAQGTDRTTCTLTQAGEPDPGVRPSPEASEEARLSEGYRWGPWNLPQLAAIVEAATKVRANQDGHRLVAGELVGAALDKARDIIADA